jgi:hypothetical protein
MTFREVAARLFPWDFVDEEPDAILDELQRDTLTNSFYPVILMHDEKRPLSEFYYPHNPRRKVYWTEDSRAYWHFDPGFYRDSRIKPLPSEDSELVGTDWVRFSTDLARRRGIKVGVELSHTWVDKLRLAAELSDCLQRDIYGKSFRSSMCVNHPDTRAYARALFTELATRYEIDYLQTCFYGFEGAPSYREKISEVARLVRLPRGGCFCDHCRREAEAQNLAWDAIVDRLRWIADGFDRFNATQAFELNLLLHSTTTASQLFVEMPELSAWFAFRTDSYTRFWKEIYEAAHAARPAIDVRFNDCWVYPEMLGFDLRAMSPYFDSIRAADYLEQDGDPELMQVKRAFYHSIRRAVGLDKHFITALSQRVRATPALIKETILMSAQCGADGTSIASYDTATPALMRAVREGFEEAGITVEPLASGGAPLPA